MGPGGFHPVALKIGTLQLLRKNLNGIELPTADGLYGYKVTPIGSPGGKRIMNLNLLLSTNSQNRKLQSFFCKNP